MSERFKTVLILSVSYQVIAALFLCVGLAPSYADEPDVHYYAFVMQNKNGVWDLPTDKELEPREVYRFQIVKVSSDQKWLALRGSFHFIKDTQGGVKVTLRKNLDMSSNVGDNLSSSLWNDEARDNTWEMAGRPEVLPLIDQMTREKPGAPDPNFMRFLVRKNKVQESWTLDGKTYQIERLHYLLKRSSTAADENDIKVLSRFLKPSEPATTNITKLKEWMKNQKGFESAGYLGQPDVLHQAFYQDFAKILDNFLTKRAVHIATLNVQNAKDQIKQAEKKRAQQAMIDVNSHLLEAENKLTKAKEMVIHIGETQRNQVQNEMNQLQERIDELKKHIVQPEQIKPQIKPQDNAVLFILIIITTIAILIGIAAWFYPEKLRNLWPTAKTDDEMDPYSNEEQSIISQSTAPVSKLLKQTRYVSKEELSSSLQKLRNPLLERIIGIEKMLGIEANMADIAKEKQTFLKESTEAQSGLPNEPARKEGALPIMLSNYVSKEELAVVVEKAVEQFLANHFFYLFSQSLKKLSQEEKFEEVVRQQVLAYLNNNQFKNGLNMTLESYAENYLNKFREENAVSTPRYSTHSTMGNKISKTTPTVTAEPQPRETATAAAPKPIPESQQPDSATHEVIEKIKTVLSSMDSVDKTALNTLEVTTEPCLFLNNVVANCLKLNQPVTHYQRLDHAIGELTEGKVALIIPNVGDEFIPAEHNAVAQQTASKGKLNVVATLARPGIKCENDVRRKAEVVQTV